MTSYMSTWRRFQIFWRKHISFVKSGYWPKFQVNVIWDLEVTIILTDNKFD